MAVSDEKAMRLKGQGELALSIVMLLRKKIAALDSLDRCRVQGCWELVPKFRFRDLYAVEVSR
jgi:hypothetical protein